jgi:hypothetical protein
MLKISSSHGSHVAFAKFFLKHDDKSNTKILLGCGASNSCLMYKNIQHLYAASIIKRLYGGQCSILPKNCLCKVIKLDIKYG